MDLKVSDLELVDCLRADILAAQQQQPEENDSSFMVIVTKLMQVQKSWH